MLLCEIAKGLQFPGVMSQGLPLGGRQHILSEFCHVGLRAPQMVRLDLTLPSSPALQK